MKTPEKIKKELANCTDKTNCSWCPNSHICALEANALAYIQQLEADVRIANIKKDAMYAKAEQLEAERDALLKYLTNSHFVPCDICKHDKGDIMACERVRKVHGPCFEWCGLLDDAGGEEHAAD